MSTFDWVGFLRRWSEEIIEQTYNQQPQWPMEVLATKWLGVSGATEDQITQAEARLGTTLPPSYREFLKASNGWRATTPFIERLWSTEEIEWFSSRRQDWINQHIERYRKASHLESNGHLERPTVPDEEYFVYGDNQDCRTLRIEYLQTALEISDIGDSAIYLLNPEVVTTDGEWEAWFLADWLPGADRYPSFQALMQAEYQNSLELWSLPPDAENAPEKLSIQPPRQTEVDNEGHESRTQRFILEVQRKSFGTFLERRIIIYDEARNVRKLWSSFAINEASQWMIQQVLKLHQKANCGFILKFQAKESNNQLETRTIIYDNIGNVKYLWLGLELEKACQWIVEQRKKSFSANTSLKPRAITSMMRVEMSQVNLYQPPENTNPTPVIRHRRVIGATINGHQNFTLEVLFNLENVVPQSGYAEPIKYQVQVSAKNFQSDISNTLIEEKRGALDQDQNLYRALLPRISLPSGVYSIKMIFLLFQERVFAFSYHEVPFLQVT